MRALDITPGTLADTCFWQLRQYRLLRSYCIVSHVIFICSSTLEYWSVTPERLSSPQSGQTLQSSLCPVYVYRPPCDAGLLPLLPDETFSVTVTVRMPWALTLRSLSAAITSTLARISSSCCMYVSSVLDNSLRICTSSVQH